MARFQYNQHQNYIVVSDILIHTLIALENKHHQKLAVLPLRLSCSHHSIHLDTETTTHSIPIQARYRERAERNIEEFA